MHDTSTVPYYLKQQSAQPGHQRIFQVSPCSGMYCLWSQTWTDPSLSVDMCPDSPSCPAIDQDQSQGSHTTHGSSILTENIRTINMIKKT